MELGSGRDLRRGEVSGMVSVFLVGEVREKAPVAAESSTVVVVSLTRSCVAGAAADGASRGLVTVSRLFGRNRATWPRSGLESSWLGLGGDVSRLALGVLRGEEGSTAAFVSSIYVCSLAAKLMLLAAFAGVCLDEEFCLFFIAVFIQWISGGVGMYGTSMFMKPCAERDFYSTRR